jgi:hypothetical protein
LRRRRCTTTRVDLELELAQKLEDRDEASSPNIYKNEHTSVSTPTIGSNADSSGTIAASEAPVQILYNNSPGPNSIRI